MRLKGDNERGEEVDEESDDDNTGEVGDDPESPIEESDDVDVGEETGLRHVNVGIDSCWGGD